MRREKRQPEINAFARRLASDLGKILDPWPTKLGGPALHSRVKHAERLEVLIPYRQFLPPRTRSDLAKILRIVAQRASDYAAAVFSDETPPLRVAMAALDRLISRSQGTRAGSEAPGRRRRRRRREEGDRGERLE